MVTKRKITVDTLTEEQIHSVLNSVPARIFQTETEIIYKDQVPLAAYLIVEGSVRIYNKKMMIDQVKAGQLLGVRELLGHKPFKYTAKITPHSHVSILDKSSIQEILEKIELPNLS